MNLNTLSQYLLSLAVVAGLVILAALDKVSGDTAVAVIAGLGGVHIGGNIATPNTVTNTFAAPTTVEKPVDPANPMGV